MNLAGKLTIFFLNPKNTILIKKCVYNIILSLQIIKQMSDVCIKKNYNSFKKQNHCHDW